MPRTESTVTPTQRQAWRRLAGGVTEETAKPRLTSSPLCPLKRLRVADGKGCRRFRHTPSPRPEGSEQSNASSHPPSAHPVPLDRECLAPGTRAQCLPDWAFQATLLSQGKHRHRRRAPGRMEAVVTNSALGPTTVRQDRRQSAVIEVRHAAAHRRLSRMHSLHKDVPCCVLAVYYLGACAGQRLSDLVTRPGQRSWWRPVRAGREVEKGQREVLNHPSAHQGSDDKVTRPSKAIGPGKDRRPWIDGSGTVSYRRKWREDETRARERRRRRAAMMWCVVSVSCQFRICIVMSRR